MLQFLLTSYADDINSGPRCGMWLFAPIFLFFYTLIFVLISNFVVFITWLITALKKREYHKIYIGLIPVLNILTVVKELKLSKWVIVVYFLIMLPCAIFFLISVVLYGGYWLAYICSKGLS